MKKSLFLSQGILQQFIGIGGLICGIMMIMDPSGRLMQMPLSLLHGSPFNNFLIPGIILFLVNGAGTMFAGILSFRRSRYAGFAGVFFGSGLVIWIVVQVMMIGLGHWLQPFYLGLGLIEVIFGLIMHVQVKRPV